MQTFRTARQIAGQATSTPAVVCFSDKLVMVYTDSSSSQLWCTSSTNGWDWSTAQKISGQFTSIPALAVFNSTLYMVYSDSTSSQLWWTSSIDGEKWSQAQQIPGQATSVPALVAYDTYLFMVYSDSSSSQLWQTQATYNDDGALTWSGAGRIVGQGTSIPALTVFDNKADNSKKVIMVYSDSSSSKMWTTQYDGTNWTAATVIQGQYTSVPALAVVGDWIVMVYSDSNSSKFWATRSKDGLYWQDTITIASQFGSIPALAVMHDVLWMVYSDSTSSQLWVTSTVNGDIVPHAPTLNPTQQDLANSAPDSGFWLDVASSQFPGQALDQNLPLYYAVQENEDGAKITYVVLYAYQGGQTIRGLYISGQYFDCIISSTGSHVGDVERVSVYLQNDNDPGTYTFTGMEFEAHGNTYPSNERYSRSQLQWDTSSAPGQPTHPVVLVGLGGHGCWNPKNLDVKDNRVVVDSREHIVEIGDYFGDTTSTSGWWRPWSFGYPTLKLLGLDANKKPVGDQVWAAYCGKLGPSGPTTPDSATYFDGSNLSGKDWSQVKVVWNTASVLNPIEDELKQGDGPDGPGVRNWINPSL